MARQGWRNPARGGQYETLASQWLTQRGLIPVTRNFRCRHGEIDLIMREGDCIVFVEVRYRASPKFGDGTESITAAKRRKLINCASVYLQQSGAHWRQNARFDVVSIGGKEPRYSLEWIPDAFTL